MAQPAGVTLESARGDLNQSVKYQATDGTPFDLGDKEAVDDEQSNSEEEREKIYGNDASNHLSYSKMLRAMDLLHARESYFCEEEKE